MKHGRPYLRPPMPVSIFALGAEPPGDKAEGKNLACAEAPEAWIMIFLRNHSYSSSHFVFRLPERQIAYFTFPLAFETAFGQQ